MTSRFLQLFKPFTHLTFEVKKPDRTVSFKEKAAWTIACLIVYFIMISVPLYGIEIGTGQADPFFAMRAILASQRGTLGELGIGPIVTAGLIMQLLVGSQIIKVDFNNPEERALYTGAQKVLSVLMILFEAGAYIFGGAYGENIDLLTGTLIFLQLLAAGLVIMMMDELIQKGYGLGSGISLFIAAGVSFNIINGLFSFSEGLGEAPAGRYYGAIIALVYGLSHGDRFMNLIYRATNPDIIAFLATILVFAVVIYVESMRIEIPISHAQYKIPARYPIKFLYVSNIPVILASALFANVYFISQILYRKLQGHPIVDLIGTWDFSGQQPMPTGGLALYTTAPRGISQVVDDPIRAVIYMALLVGACIIFSAIWLETAGMSSRDVAKQLLDADMQIPGFRRNPKILEKYLDRYIPTAAILGGVFVGILAGFADFLGALGTGTGILLTTGIIKQYSEIIAKERLAEIAPAVRGFLGME
ncbi:MAG: preprotein translocase subunit SecY [Candidatus Heimdallarchaeota archaeon]|nr:preprotein translocase subunit SecY [Candidatus Heimdallarchaeota archaeon]